MYERCSATNLHTDFEIDLLEVRRYKQLLQFMFKISKTLGHDIADDRSRTRAYDKVKFDYVINHYTTSDKSPWTSRGGAWGTLRGDLILEITNSYNMFFYVEGTLAVTKSDVVLLISRAGYM